MSTLHGGYSMTFYGSWSTAHRGPWCLVLFLMILGVFPVISMGSGGWRGGGVGWGRDNNVCCRCSIGCESRSLPRKSTYMFHQCHQCHIFNALCLAQCLLRQARGLYTAVFQVSVWCVFPFFLLCLLLLFCCCGWDAGQGWMKFRTC